MADELKIKLKIEEFVFEEGEERIPLISVFLSTEPKGVSARLGAICATWLGELAESLHLRNLEKQSTNDALLKRRVDDHLVLHHLFNSYNFAKLRLAMIDRENQIKLEKQLRKSRQKFYDQYKTISIEVD